MHCPSRRWWGAGLRRAALLLVVALAGFLACSKKDRNNPAAPSPPPDLSLQLVDDNFDFPVYVTAPGGDDRLFVVEKQGTVLIVKNGTVLGTPFLDLRGQVSLGTEQGLLGLAFDPDYDSNGRLYVFYTDPSGDEVIARYQVSSNPDVASPSGEPLLTIDDVHEYHNGGMLSFGPDGMLWASVGDGGGANDTWGFAQTKTDLMGSLLRIDVRGAGGYVNPADNPFTGAGERRELWNIGLRNSWRFSFDRATGDLYIGDVGQDQVEEIDVSTAASGRGRGANYGWSIEEGTDCFHPSSGCNIAGLVQPVLTYSHSEGCAVVGGYVYRGAAMPSLRGTYFYGDYCNGWVRSFRMQGGQAVDRQEWTALDTNGSIISFGEDGHGELYIATEGGSVYRIVKAP